jgi:AraC-like DNA-binding protein
VDFTYVTRQPTGLLAQFVESIWYARGQITYRREQIAPTGSTVAGIVLGAPIRQTAGDGTVLEAATGFLIGPHDRPIVNEPTGETFCVGIVAAPAGCEAVFGVRPAELRARVVDLATAWPAAIPLRTELLTLSTPDEMIDRVVAALHVDENVPRLDRCHEAVAALQADPTRSIAEVAAELGVSHGHLDREFIRLVGLSPRTLSRILRLRKLLDHIDVYGQVAWTGHAAALGWYDQAHLIRDFKRHTGVTPSEYQAAQRDTYTPEQAEPGFVPQVKSVQDD